MKKTLVGKIEISIPDVEQEVNMERTKIPNEEIGTKNTIDRITLTREKNKESSKYITVEEAHLIQPKIDIFKKKGEWINLLNLLKPICKKYKGEYYYFSELARVYDQLGEYTKALSYIDMAYSIEKKDVMVLYDRGVILESNERYEDAIKMFDKIFKQNILRVAYIFPGEGIKWTRSIYNDSRYLKGICFMKLGDYTRARYYIKLHIAKRCRGQYSDFSKQQVIKRYKTLLEQMKTSTK